MTIICFCQPVPFGHKLNPFYNILQVKMSPIPSDNGISCTRNA